MIEKQRKDKRGVGYREEREREWRENMENRERGTRKRRVVCDMDR